MSLVKLLQASTRGLFPHHARTLSSSPVIRGLEEFVEPPTKEGESLATAAGRAWTAALLRTKSWDDLHKLWFVLLKERNLLESERLRTRAKGERLRNPFRLTKVRKGMGRIKEVLHERALAEENPHRKAELKRFINAL